MLEERGYGAALASGKVRLIRGEFIEHCGTAIARCQARSPRSGRALFILDQYGYSNVSMHCLRDIFASLKYAEVILTLYIDSLINYLNESNLAAFQKATGISASVQASEIDEIKQSPRWRVHLQSSLYQNLTDQCWLGSTPPFLSVPSGVMATSGCSIFPSTGRPGM